MPAFERGHLHRQPHPEDRGKGKEAQVDFDHQFDSFFVSQVQLLCRTYLILVGNDQAERLGDPSTYALTGKVSRLFLRLTDARSRCR